MKLFVLVPRTSRTRKVQIRNIPSSMNWEDLDSLLSKFGRVESCEQVSTECESATVNVVYASRQVRHQGVRRPSNLNSNYLIQEALAAVRDLNGHTQKDQMLRCSFLPDSHDTDRNHRSRPRQNFISIKLEYENQYLFQSIWIWKSWCA